MWNISSGDQYQSINSDADFVEVETKVNANRVELPAGDLFLPQVFKKAGYVTVASAGGSMIVDSDGWKLRHNKKTDEYRLYYLPRDYKEETNISNPKKIEKLKGYLKQFSK